MNDRIKKSKRGKNIREKSPFYLIDQECEQRGLKIREPGCKVVVKRR